MAYSDGITEAMNASEAQFGEERLMTVVMDNWRDSSSELIEKIIAAVKSYTDNTPPIDDMTLVVVKRA